MTGLDPYSFIRLLIVYGNVGHILMLEVGEKLGISRHCGISSETAHEKRPAAEVQIIHSV